MAPKTGRKDAKKRLPKSKAAGDGGNPERLEALDQTYTVDSPVSKNAPDVVKSPGIAKNISKWADEKHKESLTPVSNASSPLKSPPAKKKAAGDLATPPAKKAKGKKGTPVATKTASPAVKPTPDFKNLLKKLGPAAVNAKKPVDFDEYAQERGWTEQDFEDSDLDDDSDGIVYESGDENDGENESEDEEAKDEVKHIKSVKKGPTETSGDKFDFLSQGKVAIKALHNYSKENAKKNLLDTASSVFISLRYKLPAYKSFKFGQQTLFELPFPDKNPTTASLCLILPDLSHNENDWHDADVEKQEREWADILKEKYGITGREVSKIYTFISLKRQFMDKTARDKLMRSYDVFAIEYSVYKDMLLYFGPDKIRKEGRIICPIRTDRKSFPEQIRRASRLAVYDQRPGQILSTIRIGNVSQSITELTANFSAATDAIFKHVPGGFTNISTARLEGDKCKPALPFYVNFGSKDEVPLKKPAPYVPDVTVEDVTTVDDGYLIRIEDGDVEVVDAETKEPVAYPTTEHEHEAGDDILPVDVEEKKVKRERYLQIRDAGLFDPKKRSKKQKRLSNGAPKTTKDEVKENDDDDKEEQVPPKKVAKKEAAAPVPKPPVKGKRGKKAAIVDEETESEVAALAPVPAKRQRRQSAVEEEDTPIVPPSKKTANKGKKRQAVDSEDDEGVIASPPAKGKKKAGGKAKAVREAPEEPEEPILASPAAKTIKKRGNKAKTPVDAPEESEEPILASPAAKTNKKRGGKAKAVVAVPEEAEEPITTSPAVVKAKKTRGGKAKTAPVPEEAEEPVAAAAAKPKSKPRAKVPDTEFSVSPAAPKPSPGGIKTRKQRRGR